MIALNAFLIISEYLQQSLHFERFKVFVHTCTVMDYYEQALRRELSQIPAHNANL